jgi:hypothetical protein
MLLICAQSYEHGVSSLAIKSLNRQEECWRVSCAIRIESGTVLVSLRGNSMGLHDGRSIVCVGASEVGLKRSKLISFVNSVGA